MPACWKRFVDAMERTFDMSLQILEYGEHAMSQSANADAVTYLQVKYEGKRFTGIAIDEDIVTSSVNALLNAVSQVFRARRQDSGLILLFPRENSSRFKSMERSTLGVVTVR